MSKTYDFLVIGGGSAGYAAARTAHEFGLKTAVVDGAPELGGLCILRGCMPSKTLIESSNRFRAMRRASEFGLSAENLSVSTEKIIARKRVLIDDFASYRQQQLQDERFDLIRGHASFSSPHSVTVRPLGGGDPFEVEFKTSLISAGSKISRIHIDGLEETGYWTSNDVLDAETVPPSFIVLGGGAIALEMACYLEGIGRNVTVIQRSDQVLSGSDRDVADAVKDAINERENINIITGTSLKRVTLDPESGKKVVIFEKDGKEQQVEANEILQALGRSPHSDGLQTSEANVAVDHKGRVECGPDQRTSTEHIFAAGDICGPHEIVHIAIEQGEIAANNAAIHLGKNARPIRKMDYRLVLLGIFTDPEVATVGLTEEEAKKKGLSLASATYPFDDHGKSMVKGETHGFVKMIANTETGEIVGAAVVGPEATELIHEITVAMHFHCTTEEFLKIPHYHPTLSEIWTYPAEDLLFSD
ncbi:MAG: dihydrolipoamide dehydrogenase [Verrucomicrobiales bacterium]|nr:dihydrolipoamide dehydrogenase [Verrucomicrobiales bacterium]